MRHLCALTVADSVDGLVEVGLCKSVLSEICQLGSGLDVVEHHLVQLHDRSVGGVGITHTARFINQVFVHIAVSIIARSSVNSSYTVQAQTTLLVDVVSETWVTVLNFLGIFLTLIVGVASLVDGQTVLGQEGIDERT